MNIRPLFSQRKLTIIAGAIIIVCIGIYIFYSLFLSPTQIALINFPEYQATNMIIANDSRHIKIDEINQEESKAALKKYDAILLFGRGLRLSENLYKEITQAEDKGVPIYTVSYSSYPTLIANIDSAKINQIQAYTHNNCRANYRNLLRYIHNELDSRKLFQTPVEEPIYIPNNLFFHIGESNFFETKDQLTKYLKEKHIYKEGAPNLAFISSLNFPPEDNRAHIDSLITSVERAGYNVYPIAGSREERIEMIKSVNPTAIIHFPMGRLGDDNFVKWMTENNTPFFCPFPLIEKREDWLDQNRPITGGVLTARVVIPEIDGGIAPILISTQNIHSNGYSLSDPEPERIASFTAYMKNYLSLHNKQNKDKKVAICYFKHPGQTALLATGMEVAPSLYEFLKRLKTEGYTVNNLPSTFEEFNRMLQKEGSVLGGYAKGAQAKFMKEGDPLWIKKSIYEEWAKEIIPTDKYKEVTDRYGEAPGEFQSGMHDGEPSLAVACLRFGNVVVFPQPRPAMGDDEFRIVHGAAVAPPHAYIAPYLWVQKGFKADAIIHFGTHGSLEFTPGKQAGLSPRDWADCLIGNLPHFYYYTITNIGEAIIAKRRTRAALVSYLTPPFMENGTRGLYSEMHDDVHSYFKAGGKAQEKLALKIKQAVVRLGLHRDLQLDSVLSRPYTYEDIERIENYAEELANEKMTGQLYTLGHPYSDKDMVATVVAMTADPLAYGIARLDMLNKRITREQLQSTGFVSHRYLQPIKDKLKKYLSGGTFSPQNVFIELTALTQKDLEKAHETERVLRPASESEIKMGKKDKTATKASAITQEDRDFSFAVLEIENTLKNVLAYKQMLKDSPEAELKSMLNGLNGGYIAPSPGGDPVLNPNTLPTGRNMFSINAESTPGIRAWDNGKMLAETTLKQYYAKHHAYPNKVSYTFWAGEFITSEGATVAQVLYMLGVEPVRDNMNRVMDLRLIPSEELGRPRIDIVVQVSGQLRDIAGSRLTLITKAVEMASNAQNDKYENFVAKGTIESEKLLVEKGVSPKEARELALMRVFGPLNSGYSTSIMGMVEKGDAWEKDTEISNAYLNNMGAAYGTEKAWGTFTKDLFSVALHNTDVVVQPRQSNTWGAISLDHVYEFMGGLSLTIRNITGKEPEAYMSDYRNRHNVRMQNLKEAIGVESRTTLLNPNFIKEKIKGGATTAQTFAKTFRNIYGWNVMRESAIDKELWDELYNVYIKDSYRLNIQEFFKKESPAALQEMTAVMLETARKGYWKASKEQLEEIAKVHTELIKDYEAGCSSFICDNAKLQKYIAANVSKQEATSYNQNMQKVHEVAQSDKGVVLKKDDMSPESNQEKNVLNGVLIAAIVLITFGGLVIILKRRKK